MNKLFVSLFLLLASCFTVMADVTLPAIFSDSMVLQRDKEVSVWGKANPGESLTVSIKKNSVKTTADADGQWLVKLNPMTVGGPYTLEIKGQNTITFKDVLIGEVWLCSGQSNMQMPLAGWENQPVEGSEEAIAAADYPNLRLFTVKRTMAAVPQYDCEGQWAACTPELAAKFSATAFFFGRKLLKELDIPIGLIHSSWGGTPAEAWTSPDSLSRMDEFKEKVEQVRNVKDTTKTTDIFHFQAPTVLYNGMIQPLVPYGLRGAIWYQGESNASNAKLYRRLFPNMIANWRDVFQQGDFPFYFDQIAPFDYGENTKGVELREVQRETLAKVQNIGMAVLMDKTTLKNIHPPYKKEAGERMALWALAKDYGKDIVYSGPLYKKMKIEGNSIRLFFDYTGGGLDSKGQTLTQFTISGADKVAHEADVKIDGHTLVVTSSKVKEPVAVQYGWSNVALASLFNKEGLPASSFRTDEW